MIEPLVLRLCTSKRCTAQTQRTLCTERDVDSQCLAFELVDYVASRGADPIVLGVPQYPDSRNILVAKHFHHFDNESLDLITVSLIALDEDQGGKLVDAPSKKFGVTPKGVIKLCGKLIPLAILTSTVEPHKIAMHSEGLFGDV